MASDPPPAYSSLRISSTNTAVAEESVQNCVHASDDGAELLENHSFEDETTRIGFVQKVFATKLVQLFIVAAIMAVFEAHRHSMRLFMEREKNYIHLTLVSGFAFMVTVCLLVRTCRDEGRLRNPFRHLFLVLQPVSFAFLVTMVTMTFGPLTPVLVAWLNYCLVMFVVLLYSIFALQTRLEFTAKYGLVLAAFKQIIAYGISVPIADVDAITVLYPTVVFFLDMVYVLWDVQMMTSKSYWAPMTPARFLDGALNLHIDYYHMLTSNLFPKIRAAVEEEIN